RESASLAQRDNNSRFGVGLKTCIEIRRPAARRNYATFRKLLEPKTKLWAVVKSNAYGHGLLLFSKLADTLGVDGFCVDALIEGIKLRHEGIKKPILVLGPTLPKLFKDAAARDITLSISNFDALKALLAQKIVPPFHIKVDTGMHRQGFFLEDIPKVLKVMQKSKIKNQNYYRGIYTHFASAKDVNYPTYTEQQFGKFQKAITLFERAGYKNLMRHCAATAGAMLNKKYHLDAVRVGIGLYGLWPSKELEIKSGTSSRIHLKPILSWRAMISEVKNLNAGDYIGYDLAERATRRTKMAILPIGYWHGFPRALSGIGEVIMRGKRSRVLGRVSMDLLAVDVSGIKCNAGDRGTLIGKDGGEELAAFDVARNAGTIHYELLTRLNPLMERTLVA
ncbi:MAG: alanine racemase, partial [Patescibacteria group bacterium]